jgi:hypothetical protein
MRRFSSYRATGLLLVPLLIFTNTHANTWKSGTFPADLNSEVDTRLEAAGPAYEGRMIQQQIMVNPPLSSNTSVGGNMSLFSSVNDATRTYVRNKSVWTGNLDFSGVSNIRADVKNPFAACITLITPTDALMANHVRGGGVYISEGAFFLFTDNDNVSYTATIKHIEQVGTSDIAIAHISWTAGAHPASIKIYKILPDDFAHYWPDYGLNYFPCVLMNQFRQVFCHDAGVGSPREMAFRGNFFWHSVSINPLRGPYSKPIIIGDSSWPIFCVVHSEPVLLGCSFSTNMCPSVADSAAGINAALRDLDSQYQLSTVDLKDFPAF